MKSCQNTATKVVPGVPQHGGAATAHIVTYIFYKQLEGRSLKAPNIKKLQT